MLLSKCAVKRAKLVKEQKGSLLWSSLGIKYSFVSRVFNKLMQCIKWMK